MICPVNKNSDSKTKSCLLAPNIQILGSKLHIFVPSDQLKPHRYMFSTRKKCWWGYQKFYSLPKQIILGPKTAKFGPKLAFLCPVGCGLCLVRHLFTLYFLLLFHFHFQFSVFVRQIPSRMLKYMEHSFFTPGCNSLSTFGVRCQDY